MVRSGFGKFAWVLLFYTLGVIIWGAFVRASISGDGCGNNWPICGDQGTLIPAFSQTKTIIEFVHRASVPLLTILLIVQMLWAFGGLAWLGGIKNRRNGANANEPNPFAGLPKGHIARKSVIVSAFFIVLEALIGALLVKRGLVGYDASVNRAVVMSAHLVSTFVLLASLSLTAIWTTGVRPPSWKGQGPVGWALLFGFLGVVVLGVTGAIAALGDTLFPSQSLAQGFQQDFLPTAHFLTRLRLPHPLVAMSVGIYLILIAGLLIHLRPVESVKKYARWLSAVFIFQLAIGLLNLALLAPITMQLIHLFVADLTWIVLVLLAAAAFAVDAPKVELVLDAADEPVGPRSFGALVKEYVALTKPKVISLLLFTTITAMFAAARGWPGTWLLIAVSIGGYMSAGAANAINMVIDRDIDKTMKRTAKRPTVTRHISATNALLFGLALEAGSFAILWSAANLMAAMLALAGLAFYVVVYTLVLKRRTWQNIVIGGAAGSFPPLVGWAAVTNQITPLAWYLFAIIFVWTPVHFWALALMIKEDYARAGVPMLPVVHGERVTVIQILLYAVLTAVISLMPILQPHVGWTYFAVAALLNAVLLLRCLQLYISNDRPHAVKLYKFSMVYLALLFLAFAIDRVHFA